MDVLMDKKGVCWFAFYVSRAVWIGEVLAWSSQGATMPDRCVPLCSTNCIISDQSTLSAAGDSPCRGQFIDLLGDSLLHLSSLSLSTSHSLLGPLISHLFTKLNII